MKDKYGEEAARQKISQEGNEESDDESSSSSEDEDAEALTEEIEKDFFKTMACLKKKDPRIYDHETNFFDQKPKERTKPTVAKTKDKPLTLGDMERQVILEKGGNFDEIEDEELKQKSIGKSYVDEMKDIKESFLSLIEK